MVWSQPRAPRLRKGKGRRGADKKGIRKEKEALLLTKEVEVSMSAK